MIQHPEDQTPLIHLVKDQSNNGTNGQEIVNDSGNKILNQELMFEEMKTKIIEDIETALKSQIGERQEKTMQPSGGIFKVDKTWDDIKSWNRPIFDKDQIEKQHDEEMDLLVGLLVKMREENVNEFKNVIKNFISLLGDKQTESEIRERTIIILRWLANFDQQEEQAKGLRKDLCDLGFTDFLCRVISAEEKGDSQKEEYIITLVDFLDEGEEIQESLLNFMQNDRENQFLKSIYDFITRNFHDFIEYENGLQQSKS